MQDKAEGCQSTSPTVVNMDPRLRGDDRGGCCQGAELRYRRLTHCIGPRVQAMPGVEQARPLGVLRQITQPSDHSAQFGSGAAPCA